uniref:Uncharacterized protein n=1 Tax=Buteo japonicus TaxID=224669 RepID=A0A8B9Z3S6_9AVES
IPALSWLHSSSIPAPISSLSWPPACPLCRLVQPCCPSSNIHTCWCHFLQPNLCQAETCPSPPVPSGDRPPPHRAVSRLGPSTLNPGCVWAEVTPLLARVRTVVTPVPQRCPGRQRTPAAWGHPLPPAA